MNIPKTCRCFPVGLLPMQPMQVLKKVKTYSRWFHSQIIAVLELTPNILFINKCFRHTEIMVITQEDLISDK